MIGRVVGNYRIDALLGKGGMGAVYKAHDQLLDRTVALKALRADAATDQRAVDRFRMEARTLARLLHPNIATLYTLVREPATSDADSDAYYMVMEFCEGETIESILHRRDRLAPAEALPLFEQALDGLEHAHRHGIVHRDIKPANLIRLPDGTVKVMDFGIARLLGSSRMTQTHHTIGTAAYMAPEQIRSQEVDARADVYALGVLLYEILTGRVPFEGGNFFEVMQAHLQTPPPPPRQFAPDLPEGLEDVILQTLAKQPNERFDSVVALRAALQALDLPAEAPSAPSLPPDLAVTVGTPSPHGTAEPREAANDIAAKPDPAAEPDIESKPDTGHEVDALAPTVVLPAKPVAPTPSRPATPAKPKASKKQTRFTPRLALVLVGVLVVSVVGAWMLASSSPDVLNVGPDAPEAVDENGENASLSSPDVAEPLAPDSDPSDTASPPPLAAWVATGQALFDDGRLTTPADSNALLFAERILAVRPNDASARDLVRLIAQSELALGQRAQQRGNSRTARSHYQQTLAITERYPQVAPEARTSAQRGLSDLTAAATRAAQPPPSETQTASREASPPPEPEAQAAGTVRVLVRPFGDIYVDGERRANSTNAPLFAELSPGTHRIRATHPTFGSQERTVRVRSGQTSEVFIEFATPVRVTVVSDPPNAEIRLNGRSIDRYTPATIMIPPGEHTVELRRAGFRPASRTVSIDAGAAPDRLAFTLTPEN